jgi:dolichol-phosphate mannosyltransferase
MGIIYLLADSSTLRWNLTLSKVIAAEVAIVNNFFWNDLWTFRGLEAGPSDWAVRINRFGKFNLICVLGIVLSVLLLNLQVYWLHVNVYLANLVSIIVVSVWNFAMNLKFGWK